MAAEKSIGKDEWVALFEAAGLSEEMMSRWHMLFEQRHPGAHQAFLEWLEIPAEEIRAIRERSEQCDSILCGSALVGA